MPKKCNTCQGVFRPRNDDGAEYFHVCPPQNATDPTTAPERANKRDENLRRGESGQNRRMKASGSGVTDV